MFSILKFVYFLFLITYPNSARQSNNFLNKIITVILKFHVLISVISKTSYVLNSSVWSGFFFLWIFGQYLTSHSCLLLIKSHILCMKENKDNLRFGMILLSFKEDLLLLLRRS